MTDFLSLLGLSERHPLFIAAVNAMDGVEIEAFPLGRKYVMSKIAGFDFVINFGEVTSAHIFLQEYDGFQIFRGVLPLGILPDMSATELSELLGDPIGANDAGVVVYGVTERGVRVAFQYDERGERKLINILRA